MSVRVKIIIAVTAAIFAASAIGTAIVLRPAKGRAAEIVRGGEVLYVIDLESAEDMSIVIDAEGGTNTVTVEGGEIYVSAADCPDKTCMKMGKLRSEDLPIVCLPHKLVIRFAEEDR